MKNENEKYAEIVAQIKRMQPIIPDTERLTTDIMQRIEGSSQKKTPNKTLTIVSWTTSIAASILIGLFLFEQFTLPTNSKLTNSKLPDNYIHSFLHKNVETETAITDFNDWIRVKMERQKRQQALYSNIINKHKIL
jgi:hypothetical protein